MFGDVCLCYTLNSFFNRHFEVGDKGPKDAAKLFSVPDFVGDACKAIASRIRGAVAGVQFDDFHKVCLGLAFHCFISMISRNNVHYSNRKSGK